MKPANIRTCPWQRERRMAEEEGQRKWRLALTKQLSTLSKHPFFFMYNTNFVFFTAKKEKQNGQRWMDGFHFDKHMLDTRWLQQNKRGMRAVVAVAEKRPLQGRCSSRKRDRRCRCLQRPALAPWRRSFLDDAKPDPRQTQYGRQLEERRWWCGTAYLGKRVW